MKIGNYIGNVADSHLYSIYIDSSVDRNVKYVVWRLIYSSIWQTIDNNLGDVWSKKYHEVR